MRAFFAIVVGAALVTAAWLLRDTFVLKLMLMVLAAAWTVGVGAALLGPWATAGARRLRRSNAAVDGVRDGVSSADDADGAKTSSSRTMLHAASMLLWIICWASIGFTSGARWVTIALFVIALAVAWVDGNRAPRREPVESHPA